MMAYMNLLMIDHQGNLYNNHIELFNKLVKIIITAVTHKSNKTVLNDDIFLILYVTKYNIKLIVVFLSQKIKFLTSSSLIINI